jgi:hypothetical protein
VGKETKAVYMLCGGRMMKEDNNSFQSENYQILYSHFLPLEPAEGGMYHDEQPQMAIAFLQQHEVTYED